VVALNFYGKLASVTFVIDRQEELVEYQFYKKLNLQQVWLTIALSDYQ